jgi:hypothetical protein
MIFLQPSWVLAFVFAFVYLGAGRMEERHGDGRNNGILWAGLSIATICDGDSTTRWWFSARRCLSSARIWSDYCVSRYP